MLLPYTEPMTPDPPRFVDSYLLYLLAQTSAAASAGFHDHLHTRGVPVSTWRILATLSPDARLGIGELAASCLTKQPTMTSQIDRLERDGLVMRAAGTGDRRRVQVRLTDKGRALADRLITEAKTHESRLLSGHSREEVAHLKSALRRLLG